MDRLRAILVGLPRRNKRLIQVATDITVVWAALWLAFIVRLGIDEMATPFPRPSMAVCRGARGSYPAVYSFWDVSRSHAVLR